MGCAATPRPRNQTRSSSVFALAGVRRADSVPPYVVFVLILGGVRARSLGVPRDPAAARHERRISLGRVNGRRFAFAAGIGVDSDAVRALDTIKRARDRRRPGDLAYARVVLRRLLGGYEQRLELD